MRSVMTQSEIWKEAVLIYFDNAFAEGKSVEKILEEVKGIVANTDLGEMNFSLESIMDEWKRDRDMV